MKMYLRPILCLLFSIIAWTVNAQTNSYSLSVYFNSGKHSLDEKSKESLDQFINKIKELSDFELEMKAFTDDKGTMSYNIQLSEKRAASTEAYLLKAGIEPHKKIIEGLGEVALEGKASVDEERKNNRRVDIVVSHFAPQSLDDLFGYLGKDDIQYFFHDNSSDIVIYGKDGTIIDIPAKAFQNANGLEVTKVRVTLKEAYTFSDMLRNNLSTMSDDKLLETGGMIYIEVNDAESGEKLSLKPNTEIDIAITSQEAMPKGMELFLTEERKRPSENINWRPLSRKFASQKASFTRKAPKNFYLGFAEKFHPDSLFLITLEDQTEFPALPKFKEKPIAPKTVALPRFMKEQLPNKDQIISTHRKMRGEGKKKYDKRMDALFAQAELNYQTALTKNADKRINYTKDSLQYLEDVKAHEQELEKYELYLVEIENIADWLVANKKAIKEDMDEYYHLANMRGYWTTALHLRQFVGKSLGYQKHLLREAKALGLKKTQKMLEAYDFVLMDSIQKKLKHASDYERPCHRNAMRLGARSYTKNIKLNVLESWGLFEYLNGLESRTRFKGELRDVAVREIYSIRDAILGEASYCNTHIEDARELAIRYNIADFYKELYAFRLETLKWYDFVIAEKMEKGLLSDSEMQNYYVNTAKSSGLGWINCDRFMKNEGEKVDLLVDFESDENTQFFVVFKEMKSVISLSAGTTGYSVKMYDGVPKGMKVKVIGLKVKNGATQTFVKECTTEEVNSLKIDFKDAKLKDLRALLSSV